MSFTLPLHSFSKTEATAAFQDRLLAPDPGDQRRNGAAICQTRTGRHDVVSRTQLVVLGLRDDWISFDEAFDPRGLDPSRH